MKRVVNSSIAFVMVFAMIMTSGIVANASELQGNTEYRGVLESITGKQSVDNVNSVEKLDTTDTVKNVDSDFKSCRLIITNKEDMEFEDKDNTIKSVQHIDNIYIVEYFTVEATEQAYNDYLSNGYEVELDTVKDAPEGISNKDKLDNEINKEEIATTNEKKDVEKLDKINKYKDKKKEENKKETITVAVLDTGLNVGEDIFTDRLVEGKNFVDEDSDKTDDVNGHGTTMARLILDTVNDVNAENNIKIMPIKILNDEGKGTTLSAYKGIKYLIEEKQKNPDFNVVINISATGLGQSKLLNSVINEAYNNKIPVVVSAGNDNKDIFDYTPANVKSAFTISSAYEYEDEYYKSIYSNYGQGIDYCTSGDYTYTRIIDEKEVDTIVMGTSVSSVYVTGYIALLKQMAMSDEDDDNDELSITDIDNSLYLSAIALDDNKDHFGKGYLLKENIVLDPKRIKDKELDVDNVAEVNENIQLMSNYSWVTNRTIYVRDLPANGNWFVQVRVNDDNTHENIAWSDWVTKDSPNHGVFCGGGAIYINKKDDKTVEIFYDHCDISGVTPWITIGVAGDNNTKITGIGRAEPLVGHWNSAQTQTREEHYKDDEWWVGENTAGVDVYCGIGAADFNMHWDGANWSGEACVEDFIVYSEYTPKNFKVAYVPWGGTWSNGEYNTIREFEYNENGTNFFGVGVGNEAPKRDGYIFKGWYFSNSNYLEPQHGSTHSITNFVDYANRHIAVRNAYGYNLNKLYEHMVNNNDYDFSTYNRSYSDFNGPWTTDLIGNPVPDFDYSNPNGNFDSFRQLLPAGQYLAINHLYEGESIVAHAVWEKAPGFSVIYDTNGGAFDNGISEFNVQYDAMGNNSMLGTVGLDAIPKKDGSVFKGWFIVNDAVSGDIKNKPLFELVTGLIDYRNRYPDLSSLDTLSMYNMTNLWVHWNNFGKREGRSYATSPRTINENDANKGNFDNYNMLLKGGQHLSGFNKEGVYDIVNQKLRAIAVWGEDDGKRTITYNLNGAGARNDYRNPTSYTKEDNVTIYPLASWHDNDYDYTFAGWKCDKNPPGNVNSAKNPSYSWAKKDYGDLVLTAQWNKTKRTKTIGSFNYNIIWDSNGNWQDGRDDTRLLTYDHSTNTTWSWSSSSRWTDGDGKSHSEHDSDSGDYDSQASLSTYETPDTPRTATLYFDDPNAHGNTSNISAPIKTKKRFDEWQKVKSTTLNPDKSRDYDRSGNGWREYFHSYAGSTNYYYHSYSSGDGWSDSYTSRENERSTSKYYRADNPWKPNGKFRDLFNCCTETTLRAHWTRLPETLPSVSKPGYDFLGWQINGTGKIYRAGEQYTVGEDDNDVKFVAVWRRNQGKVVYNPNGAVNDNNQQYSPVTDNSYTMLNGSYTTKDGDIFGKEVTEDGFIKNETTKNKVGTTITNKYILNDGDIINTLGTTDKLSTFQGWSSINYARHDTPNILYNGYVSKFMNIYYDVTAVNKLKIANAPNPYTINNVITRANQIVTHRNNNISKWKATPRLSEIGDWFEKLTTSKLYYDPSLEGNGIVNMYATWDEFPAFTQVDDVSILSSDLSKGKDWIEDRIMRDVVVTDREYEKQGRLPYGELPHNTGNKKGNVGVEVVDLDLDAMREIGTGMTGGIYKKSKWQNPATSKYGVKAYYDELMI